MDRLDEVPLAGGGLSGFQHLEQQGVGLDLVHVPADGFAHGHAGDPAVRLVFKADAAGGVHYDDAVLNGVDDLPQLQLPQGLAEVEQIPPQHLAHLLAGLVCDLIAGFGLHLAGQNMGNEGKLADAVGQGRLVHVGPHDLLNPNHYSSLRAVRGFFCRIAQAGGKEKKKNTQRPQGGAGHRSGGGRPGFFPLLLLRHVDIADSASHVLQVGILSPL